jgi:hypothetical protein
MSSGDAIEAGRVTTGESRTVLAAATPDGQSGADFNGDVILRVEPQGGDYEPYGSHPIDGIHGVCRAGPLQYNGTGVVPSPPKWQDRPA